MNLVKKDKSTTTKNVSGRINKMHMQNKKVKETSQKSLKQDRHIAKNKKALNIIPLGGINEIGKNITVIEYGNDMFIVDCGLAFPDMDMPGVDIVIPDFTYLEKNASKIKGIVLTHGHEDHIGGLSYLLKKINVPIYGTLLTLSLVKGKLSEAGILRTCKLNVVTAGDVVKLGCFNVEFIHVNHSIPDACALAVHTPIGILIHMGDFKVDYTPIEGKAIDLARFGELGRQGVLALLSDSTNSERVGVSPSEQTVGDSFEKLFKKAADKRLIIATFASNIHRIKQIVKAAEDNKRKVAVSGRSMINVVATAIELGYIKPKAGTMIDIDKASKFNGNNIVIITTGSQGEPLSALRRMASGEHKKITVNKDDFIIISASPIPGNEKYIYSVINDLMMLGADVVYESMYQIHVSGHAYQNEQKLIMSVVKPKFFIPVHGEYRHLKKHASTAEQMGILPENIIIPELGHAIEVSKDEIKFGKTVTAGNIMVDGIGVGDVGSIVLRDRKLLAEDGLLVVTVVINREDFVTLAGPDIISRGFIYMRESEQLIDEARGVTKDILNECKLQKVKEWNNIKNKIREGLSDLFYKKTGRSPMVLPIIEVINKK